MTLSPASFFVGLAVTSRSGRDRRRCARKQKTNNPCGTERWEKHKKAKLRNNISHLYRSCESNNTCDGKKPNRRGDETNDRRIANSLPPTSATYAVFFANRLAMTVVQVSRDVYFANVLKFICWWFSKSKPVLFLYEIKQVLLQAIRSHLITRYPVYSFVYFIHI